MSKKVNEKWKKTFPDAIGNQNRPVNGVDDTQPFETGAFPQYIANDPVRYDLQNAAMSQSMSNDARLKEMVDARGKELDDHKVDPGAHKTGIAGNAATATKVVTTAAAGASANIAEATMASSDSARIRVSGAENAGELALETADNGDEAIVARQYTGTYKKVARTASILDKNGNTAFPGTVVAPNFTGELTGNAATATKLQTPRTLSLSGKAAGSTTFDGTANASINVTSVNADTASKLSTARKINIMGNATGSATFDGSGDISISTTVNESKHAAAADTATTATKVYGMYTANGGQQGPSFFGTNSAGCLMSNQSINGHGEYKNWLYMDNCDGSDVGGATAIGISRTETRAYIMSSNADRKKWDRTAELLSSVNYNSFTPTKTGGGASGTWNISISGNAASATNADKVDGYHASDLLSKIYPVGSIYMSMSATNPHDLFGVGTWQRISQGRMLLGADDSTYKAGATGGEATHTLTAEEMPAHSHSGTTSTNGNHTHEVPDCNNYNGYGNGFDSGSSGVIRYVNTTSAGGHNHTFTTDNSGGGAAHNNMPPYLVCYIWQRTA